MKKVLILSPYFPPANAADMQRVRMSLPYFKEYGWQAEVVKVKNEAYEISMDDLLLESIPKEIIIHEVEAFSKKWTAKLGLGSIALRSLWYYRKYVNQLLRKEHFDLIYFSTTQFPVCILGSYWKKKFNIPYVIDMQDPWHSDYYQDKPKDQRPKKYWFSYRLNKWLEPISMKHVVGLVSVSQSYLDTLHVRYPHTRGIPQSVITFGAFEKDFELTLEHQDQIKPAIQKEKGLIQIVYVGRGGYDMHPSARLLFQSFQELLAKDEASFECFRFYFIGTSYAPKGKGIKTIEPLAIAMGLGKYVMEETDRIPFYESIRTLQLADALVILGSNDPQYTASKIYPYILAKKPLLGIFNSNSSAYQIIQECQAGWVAALNGGENQSIQLFLSQIKTPYFEIQTDWNTFKSYSAQEMTKHQCEIFYESI